MDWVTCPSCGLKHSRRADGLCPRCRRGAGGFAPPTGTAMGGAPPPVAPAFEPRPPPPYMTDGAAAVAVPPPATAAWPDARPRPATVELTVGSIVSRSISLWWADVARYAVLGLLAYLPILVFAAAGGAFVALRAGATRPPNLLAEIVPLLVVGGVVTFAMFCVQMGGATFATLERLAGRRATLGAMIGAGFRRAWPLLGSAMVGFPLIAVASVALIVPGIMVAVAVCVSQGAIVAEGAGPIDGLKRSFALTKGHRWTLFGALIVVGLFTWALSMGANLSTLLFRLIGPAGPVLALPILLVVQGAGAAVGSVACAVAYHDLRLAKEGVDTTGLERVFE